MDVDDFGRQILNVCFGNRTCRFFSPDFGIGHFDFSNCRLGERFRVDFLFLPNRNRVKVKLCRTRNRNGTGAPETGSCLEEQNKIFQVTISFISTQNKVLGPISVNLIINLRMVFHVNFDQNKFLKTNFSL